MSYFAIVFNAIVFIEMVLKNNRQIASRCQLNLQGRVSVNSN